MALKKKNIIILFCICFILFLIYSFLYILPKLYLRNIEKIEFYNSNETLITVNLFEYDIDMDYSFDLPKEILIGKAIYFNGKEEEIIYYSFSNTFKFPNKMFRYKIKSSRVLAYQWQYSVQKIVVLFDFWEDC